MSSPALERPGNPAPEPQPPAQPGTPDEPPAPDPQPPHRPGIAEPPDIPDSPEPTTQPGPPEPQI